MLMLNQQPSNPNIKHANTQAGTLSVCKLELRFIPNEKQIQTAPNTQDLTHVDCQRLQTPLDLKPITQLQLLTPNSRHRSNTQQP